MASWDLNLGKANFAAGCLAPTPETVVSLYLRPPEIQCHLGCQVLINPRFLLTMLSCHHYLVIFHYHNCLPSDFKLLLPSVPPQTLTEEDRPQAFSCSPSQSNFTPPHCSNYSQSFAFWCKVYKRAIIAQLPSTTQRWQCNHLSANELNHSCMRLSGPHLAKSGYYLHAF